MKNAKELYEESCKLITENIDLTTDKIPEHLLKAWLSDEPVENTISIRQFFIMSVFTFAYDTYIAQKGKNPNVNLSEKFNTYNDFQLYLGLESTYRRLATGLTSMKIFDFDNYGSTPVIVNFSKSDVDRIFEQYKDFQIFKNPVKKR